jgi:hypothetical protein
MKEVRKSQKSELSLKKKSTHWVVDPEQGTTGGLSKMRVSFV